MAENNDVLFQDAGKRKYSSYYSGTDIKIYFGNFWVDEIVEIEFGLRENVAPIFGYASHIFDKVARGNRIVQGSFSINFKEVGYLQTIINSLSSQQYDDKTWFDLEEFDGSEDENGKPIEGSSSKSVEKLLANFQELTDDYEYAIWGKSGGSGDFVSSRKQDTFFHGAKYNKKSQAMKDNGFNIMITFGGTTDLKSREGSFQTAQSIVGVQLTDVATRIDPSGNPVQEIYSFIAKDISGIVQNPY